MFDLLKRHFQECWVHSLDRRGNDLRSFVRHYHHHRQFLQGFFCGENTFHLIVVFGGKGYKQSVEMLRDIFPVYINSADSNSRTKCSKREDCYFWPPTSPSWGRSCTPPSPTWRPSRSWPNPPRQRAPAAFRSENISVNFWISFSKISLIQDHISLQHFFVWNGSIYVVSTFADKILPQYILLIWNECHCLISVLW